MASTVRRRCWLAAAICGLAAPLAAQQVRFYSEFRRIDPYGNIVPPDRGGPVREILSPALMRDFSAWFQVVLSPPPGASFHFFIGQNPENAVRTTVYKPLYAKVSGQWFPDRLEPVSMPFAGVLPAAGAVPDAKVAVFWLEIRVPRHRPPGRIRLEAQLNMGEDWVIYPLELRVLFPVIPEISLPSSPLPAVAEPSSSVALPLLHAYLCDDKNTGMKSGAVAFGVRRVIQRGVHQDLALARQLETARSRQKVVDGVFQAMGIADRNGWCAASPKAPPAESGAGPEWYWRVRDFLFRLAVN